MFERDHHRRIASVLQALDAQLLEDSGCYFGGGTAIALKYGEYRESIDVDFLVSDKAGYRALRQSIATEGITAITRPRATLTQARDVRADQYGIRTLLAVEGAEVKFEIVLEGRITLEKPTIDDRICGIATLTTLDMATSKLLANSDRWADDGVNSRDLIDLAMMDLDKGTLHAAIEKASAAYGASIERDLAKAIATLRARRGRLEACMRALQMTTVPRAVVLQRIRALATRAPRSRK